MPSGRGHKYAGRLTETGEDFLRAGATGMPRREETDRFGQLADGDVLLPQRARDDTEREVRLGKVGAGSHGALAERLRGGGADASDLLERS